mmetsp:Transcript_24184/g.37994  ORF Transcript_24184/g.37994 Transcript_24184/m.37994 type:complete len:131 (+) Transcript_24184:1248-1640(+)
MTSKPKRKGTRQRLGMMFSRESFDQLTSSLIHSRLKSLRIRVVADHKPGFKDRTYVIKGWSTTQEALPMRATFEKYGLSNSKCSFSTSSKHSSGISRSNASTFSFSCSMVVAPMITAPMYSLSAHQRSAS